MEREHDEKRIEKQTICQKNWMEEPAGSFV